MQSFEEHIDSAYQKHIYSANHGKTNLFETHVKPKDWDFIRSFFINYFSEMGMDLDKAVDEKVQDVLSKVFKEESQKEVVQEVMKQYKEEETPNRAEYDLLGDSPNVLVARSVWNETMKRLGELNHANSNECDKLLNPERSKMRKLLDEIVIKDVWSFDEKGRTDIHIQQIGAIVNILKYLLK